MPDGTLLLNGPINNAIVLHEVDNDNPQLYINNENGKMVTPHLKLIKNPLPNTKLLFQ